MCQLIDLVKVSWVAKMTVSACRDSQVEMFDMSRVTLKRVKKRRSFHTNVCVYIDSQLGRWWCK